MSLLTRKRTILAKIESVYGTDPTPTGGANAILVRNMTLTPLEAQLVNLDRIRPYFGNSPTLLAQSNVKIEFEVELAGSGTAGTAPGWDCLMQACAFSPTVVAVTSVTYNPITDSLPSVTMYYNVDGVLHKITGARGTFQLSIAVKAIPTLKFTFTGIYNAPSDASAPTVDFTAFQLPRLVNTANTPVFSLFSYSAPLESMTLNLAGDVQYRTLVGEEEVLFLDRKPSGTFVIEAPHIATKDYFSIAQAGTLGSMTLTHGTVAGNIVQINAPKVSIQNPTYQDSQGIQMLSIPFVPTPNTGNDEISIVLT